MTETTRDPGRVGEASTHLAPDETEHSLIVESVGASGKAEADIVDQLAKIKSSGDDHGQAGLVTALA